MITDDLTTPHSELGEPMKTTEPDTAKAAPVSKLRAVLPTVAITTGSFIVGVALFAAVAVLFFGAGLPGTPASSTAPAAAANESAACTAFLNAGGAFADTVPPNATEAELAPYLATAMAAVRDAATLADGDALRTALTAVADAGATDNEDGSKTVIALCIRDHGFSQSTFDKWSAAKNVGVAQ